MYVGSTSIEIEFRFTSIAAIAVVPSAGKRIDHNIARKAKHLDQSARGSRLERGLGGPDGAAR